MKHYDKKNTCYGCINLTSKWYVDSSVYYGCTLIPGLIRGLWSGFEDDHDPKRCDKFVKDPNYEIL